MTQCSVGFSVSKNALNPYEPHREKTGFLHMRKKDADQLRGNREGDQRLCFRYKRIVQSLYFLNTKFQASSHLMWLYSPETPKTGFLTTRLI